MKLCPICNKRESSAYKPFCSERCVQVDLGRWLTESYRVLETPEQDEEE